MKIAHNLKQAKEKIPYRNSRTPNNTRIYWQRIEIAGHKQNKPFNSNAINEYLLIGGNHSRLTLRNKIGILLRYCIQFLP